MHSYHLLRDSRDDKTDGCEMPTYRPPSGAEKWTVQELKGIPKEWHGSFISDGGGLNGKVWASHKGVTISFRYGYRWGDKKRWYGCGTWPEKTLAAIRATRDDAKAIIRNKQEPTESKKAEKFLQTKRIQETIAEQKNQQAAELTVTDLFNVWVSNGISHKDGNKEVSRIFQKRVLPSIGKIKLSELSETHLSNLYKGVATEGKTRMMIMMGRLVKQMLSWGERRLPWRRLLIDGNPADLVQPHQYAPHDYSGIRVRVLSREEIKILYTKFRQAEQEYYSSTDRRASDRPMLKRTEIAVWICLSTLCRIGELSKAQWKDVDFEKRKWMIPARNVKAHRGQARSHTVHLSDFAVSQFRELQALTGKTPWLFPSEKLGHPTAPSTFAKQIGDRQQRFGLSKGKLNRAQSDRLVIGVEKWTLHDLRRTGSTLMAELGISREIINLCQNHLVGSSIDRHYIHYDHRDKKSDAWNQLGQELQKLIPSNFLSIYPAEGSNSSENLFSQTTSIESKRKSA